MTFPPEIIKQVPRRMLLAARDWLFGYDFFISYHWDSGGEYAVSLAQRLRNKRYHVFLDRAEYAMGDDWLSEGRRALRNTTRLILIGTRDAICVSDPVLKEITEFTARSQRILPILFQQELSMQDEAESPILKLIPKTILFIREKQENRDRGPSDDVLRTLELTHRVLRRRAIRTLLIAIAFSLLVAAALVTLWQRHQAIISRDSLAMQLAASEFDRSNQSSQTGGDSRVAFWHALRAAQLAPNGDPMRGTYIDSALMAATQLPNRVVNLADLHHDLVLSLPSPNLRYVVAITSQYQLAGWDLQNGSPLSMPEGVIAGYSGDDAIGDERSEGVRSLTISPDSSLGMVVLGNFPCKLSVWELNSGRLLHERPVEDCFGIFQFSSDSRKVLYIESAAEAGSDASTALQHSRVVWQSSETLDSVSTPLSVRLQAESSAEPAKGRTSVRLSENGYASFWRDVPEILVQPLPHSQCVASTVSRHGDSFLVMKDGRLIQANESVEARSVSLGLDSTEEIESANLRLSADEQRLVLQYSAIVIGTSETRYRVEIRSSSSLQLLSGCNYSSSPDVFVKEIAVVEHTDDLIVFAQRYADSDYVHTECLNTKTAVFGSHRVFQRGGFSGFTADGCYSVVSRDSDDEVSLNAIAGIAPLTLGPYRFPDNKSLALLLRESWDIRQSVDGLTCRLGDSNLTLIEQSLGTQVFLNGTRVQGVSDVMPVTCSPDGKRWFGIAIRSELDDQTTNGFTAYLIDTATGHKIGRFSSSLGPDCKFAFLSGGNAVMGISENHLLRFTTQCGFDSPPEWCRYMGAALTGVSMDEFRNTRTLKPAEHTRIRHQFLQDLKQSTGNGSNIAKRMHDYFRDDTE